MVYHYVVEHNRKDLCNNRVSGIVKSIYPEKAYEYALKAGSQKLYLEPHNCIVSTLVLLG